MVLVDSIGSKLCKVKEKEKNTKASFIHKLNLMIVLVTNRCNYKVNDYMYLLKNIVCI